MRCTEKEVPEQAYVWASVKELVSEDCLCWRSDGHRVAPGSGIRRTFWVRRPWQTHRSSFPHALARAQFLGLGQQAVSLARTTRRSFSYKSKALVKPFSVSRVHKYCQFPHFILEGIYDLLSLWLWHKQYKSSPKLQLVP